MKKIIYRLCILFLAIASVSCKKDPPEEPEAFDFKVADGMIQSPQWLVDKVNYHYEQSSWGIKTYPSVYRIEYNGRKYIWIMDGMMSGTGTGGYFFFTLSGDPVVWRSDLWDELHDIAGPVGEEDDLLWRYEYRSRKSKSISTRADRLIPFYTPNSTLVPDTYTLDETIDTPAEILAAREFYKSCYPNAEEVSGPSDTYNCHGYAWSITEGGPTVWIGLGYAGETHRFVDDGSYIPTSPDTPGAKVRYLNADHSAIAETADIFVSKWHKYPLYRHHKNDSPFPKSGATPQVAYYKRNTPLVITGPDSPSLNTNVTYSVPTAQNITFNRWEITGGGYTTTSGLNSRNLTIKFTSAATYTLKAIFNLPNNYGPYTATKTVKLSSPPLPTPVIKVSNYGYEWSGDLEVWRPSFYSTPWFTVQNPGSGLTYEWSINWPQLQSRTAAYAGMTHIMYLYPPIPATPRTAQYVFPLVAGQKRQTDNIPNGATPLRLCSTGIPCLTTKEGPTASIWQNSCKPTPEWPSIKQSQFIRRAPSVDSGLVV